jgi:hypothetical protein
MSREMLVSVLLVAAFKLAWSLVLSADGPSGILTKSILLSLLLSAVFPMSPLGLALTLLPPPLSLPTLTPLLLPALPRPLTKVPFCDFKIVTTFDQRIGIEMKTIYLVKYIYVKTKKKLFFNFL